MGIPAGLLLLSACTVGPDYQRPDAPVPAQYKEAGWKVGEPLDAIDRGAWWSVYKDPLLDELQRQIDISNQNLKAAAAAFEEAEWIVAQARAAFFPTVDLNASAQRSRTGGGSSSSTGAGRSGFTSSQFSTSASASWVPDLWGKIRRTVEGDVASAQASAGDLASARLSAQGTLASDYLQLRMSDELKRLFDAAASYYAESLRITRNQYRSGIADQSAVSQAEAQLESTQSQAIAVGVTRAQLEHAIAVLIGKPPAEFSIPPTEAKIAVPVIPAEMPSALLERRPDIAASERQMAAANAQIGVAVAAFYPNITLSADNGTSALTLNRLLATTSRFWSFGSNLVQTVFDAGARSAQVEQARAVFDQDVANYRQTVLTAFQQVEDQLAALRILAEQAEVQDKAVAAAFEAARILNNQYLAGTVAFTSVIVADQTALANAETAVNIRQSRLVASAALIQALGGGWDTTQLPSRDRIEENAPLNFSPFPPAEQVRAP
ncbi:MAG TPA: efflux transporter outer membrane subunit [Stellaceae bacterium]|nr:efflux transporter outer membrane subunit [Stellaceae bacterium]HMD65902.1 efflux transporter outer membrane subunit [Stellaceae bacterium]